MSTAITPLADIRCPDCGKLMFRAAGPFDIEIMCNGIACKAASRVGEGNRIKRLTYPNPATKNRRLADERHGIGKVSEVFQSR